jgi:hypothetical protein
MIHYSPLRPSDFQNWLLESVRYFRPLGFFKKYHFLSDEELVSELHQIGWNGEPTPSYGVTDLSLLVIDHEVVWWRDTEAEVFMGNNVYVRVLQEWRAISRQTFLPEHIEEVWGSKDGPIEIGFSHKRKQVKIHAESIGDYLDLRILSQINELIRDSGVQFEAYEAFDQSAFIIALTAVERQKLETERGWRFERFAGS